MHEALVSEVATELLLLDAEAYPILAPISNGGGCQWNSRADGDDLQMGGSGPLEERGRGSGRRRLLLEDTASLAATVMMGREEG